MEAKKAQAVKFTAPDEPGTMGKVLSKLAEAGINVVAFSAWVEDGHGEFRLYVEDSKKAAEAIKGAGCLPEMEEVIVVTAENRVGVAAEIGRKLGDAGVNIVKTFATSGVGGAGTVVLMTDDNDKAVAALT